MKKSIIAKVAEMKVAEMREVAGQYGIKNAKKYKRTELETLLVEAMFAKAKAATNKRYKATQVTDGEIEVQADKIIAEHTIVGLFDVNRKVLIVVMKKLKCEKWYRTYDKPTMVDKIKTALVA